MSRNRSFSIVSMAVLTMLVTSALFTTPAFADGGSIPGQTPSPTAPAARSGPSASLPPAPAGTKLVVLDSSGAKLPLGSQAAQAAVGDPLWCPSSVLTPLGGGLNGCSASYGNLYNLINAINLHNTLVPNANGTIWIFSYAHNLNAADSSASTIVIDGNNLNFNTWKNFSLTLKGGWDGFGTHTVTTGSPSIFGQEIKILNWNNNVTLSDLQTNNTASHEGLDVVTTKNISLTDVHADNNTGYGALLDSGGTVTLTNSAFNGDALVFDAHSLEVDALGAVTLNNVQVNGGWGTLVDNSGALSSQPVTISASNFNSNANRGLTVDSKGVITAANVSASLNTNSNSYGALLDNHYSGTGAGVVLTGTNSFAGNANLGIEVLSKGTITQSGVLTADSNAAGGAILDNTGASSPQGVTLATAFGDGNGTGDGLDVMSHGAITISTLIAGSNGAGYGAWLQNDYFGSSGGVTLTVSGTLTSNGLDGLRVNSNGAIKLNGLEADANGGAGASLDNQTGTGAPTVSLTGSAIFSNNGSDGLDVSSHGSITSVPIIADSNGAGGAALVNNYTGFTGGVTVSGIGSSVFTNTAGGSGLVVSTNGAIKLGAIIADANVGGYGVSLDNCHLFGGVCTGTGTVTLTGTGIFSSNGSDGLHVTSQGTIALNGVYADANASGFGVWVSNHFSGATAGVTLTGDNGFTLNKLGGLNVQSNGAVQLNSILAESNTAGAGVNIDNHFVSAQSVILTGGLTAAANSYAGLVVLSKGSISAADLTILANNSSGLGAGGAYLDSTAGTLGVTLTGTNIFNANTGHGLDIQSNGGAVNLQNVIADRNTGDGLLVHNTTGLPSGQGVTISGTNEFKFNTGNGLDISSDGAVALKNITADASSTGIGAHIDNTFSTMAHPKTVTLTGTSTFNDNHLAGLSVATFGAITASNLTADRNNLTGSNPGANLDNHSATTPAGVTLTGTNVFDGNGGSGLNVQSLGAIKISNITADKNINTNGARLVNDYLGAGTNGVTLTGTNEFNGDNTSGLLIFTYGAVSLNNITANGSVTNFGATIQNNFNTLAPKPVVLTGINTFNGNWDDGLGVTSYGAITLSNVSADNNGLSGTSGFGVELDNSSAPVPANVTLTGVNNFNDNYRDGLHIVSLGVLSLAKVTADLNSGTGLHVVTSAAITVTCGSFVDNGIDGIYMASPMPMTLISVTATGNSAANIFSTGGGTVTNVRACPLP